MCSGTVREPVCPLAISLNEGFSPHYYPYLRIVGFSKNLVQMEILFVVSIMISKMEKR